MSKFESLNKLLNQCPCCDYFTLTSRKQYEICKVCFWEDDGIDIDKLDKLSWPNHLTLREARSNFISFGASNIKYINDVISKNKRRKYKYEIRLIL